MPMTEKELQKRDAKCDLGAELLTSVRQMKAGRAGKIHKVAANQAVRQKRLSLLQNAALKFCVKSPSSKMSCAKLEPVHPGDILLHDFIEPMGLTRHKVAKFISVPPRRINEICARNRAITADTAMRLGRLFGMSPQTWMNLQARYDLEVAENELGDKMDREVMPLGV